LRNLEQAHAYIVKDDPEAARQLILRIQSAVGQLAEFPFMGRVGRPEATRELVISNTSYLIIYRVRRKRRNSPYPSQFKKVSRKLGDAAERLFTVFSPKIPPMCKNVKRTIKYITYPKVC
jgi:plasmid stabilization system protein ParE